MKDGKLSLTYRCLRKCGFNYSETEYGNVGIVDVISKVFSNMYHALLLDMMNWVILEPVNPRKLRPFLLRRMGASVGRGVFIGDNVKFDLNHCDMIIVEDRVHIASGTRMLCHQRDLSNYCIGDDYSKLGYTFKSIHLKKGCLVGMESFVLPGVTVGEGSIVGAGSLVANDIPDWTVAVGRPAKVIKQIPQRDRL